VNGQDEGAEHPVEEDVRLEEPDEILGAPGGGPRVDAGREEGGVEGAGARPDEAREGESGLRDEGPDRAGLEPALANEFALPGTAFVASFGSLYPAYVRGLTYLTAKRPADAGTT